MHVSTHTPTYTHDTIHKCLVELYFYFPNHEKIMRKISQWKASKSTNCGCNIRCLTIKALKWTKSRWSRGVLRSWNPTSEGHVSHNYFLTQEMLSQEYIILSSPWRIVSITCSYKKVTLSKNTLIYDRIQSYF